MASNSTIKVVSTCFQYRLPPTSMSSWIGFRHAPSNRQAHTSEELVEACADGEVAIIGDDDADSSFFERCSNLRLLIRWGAGTNNVNFEAAKKTGVQVVNTPGLFGEDVADMAIGMAISIVREIPVNAELIRQGGWPKKTTHSFRDMTAGVVGLGAVGREIARILMGIGLPVRVYDPFCEDFPDGVEVTKSLTECAITSNILFLSAPLTEETRGFVDADLLRLLSAPRFVVNVSRGELLNEKAVMECLASGLLSGLAVDVFSQEPPALGDLPGRDLNFLASSHNASNTFRSIERANERVDQVLHAYIAGSLETSS